MTKTGIGVLILCMCGLAACEDATGNDTTPVTVLLTDAPGDVLQAWVTISEIYLQGDDTDPASGGGRVTLLSDPFEADLMTLAGDFAVMVDGFEVPSGTYGQLRFVVDGGYLVVDDGGDGLVYATPGYALPDGMVADGVLMCPSCSQSGLKVSMPGGLVLDGTAATLAVDFDVAESYGHEAGQSGKWVMHPSLKTTAPPAP
jgi:hypothetical protein